MKKIYSLILFIIVIIFVMLVFINNNRVETDSFYAIKESKGYVLKNDSKMHIDVYSKLENSLITYTDKNIYQIKNDNSIYNLENVTVKTSKNGDLYVNRIEADLINTSATNLLIDDAVLNIINESYSLNIKIGTISILNPIDYTLLSFNKYYGSYSYLNGCLELVGINLELTDNYNYLSNFSINDYAKGNLSDVLYNLYNNEIDIKTILPNYNPLYFNDSKIKIESNKLFIPISYVKLLMIKEAYITLCLDDNMYYIDHFSFISNVLNYSDYENVLETGDIKYVKS